MMPPLMFRFPIIDGSSLVESGLLDFAVVVVAAGDLRLLFRLGLGEPFGSAVSVRGERE